MNHPHKATDKITATCCVRARDQHVVSTRSQRGRLPAGVAAVCSIRSSAAFRGLLLHPALPPTTTTSDLVVATMASDVLVEPRTPDQRSSSPVSSDEDAVNTPDARVYFGPFQDAERKYAQLSHAGHPTPIKPFARSSAMLHLSQTTASSSDGEVNETVEDSDASPDALDEPRAGTPSLQDDTADNGACIDRVHGLIFTSRLHRAIVGAGIKGLASMRQSIPSAKSHCLATYSSRRERYRGYTHHEHRRYQTRLRP